jgi:hypothetical protein
MKFPLTRNTFSVLGPVIFSWTFRVQTLDLRGPFEKFVDWWQCAAIMQKEAVVTYAKL